MYKTRRVQIFLKSQTISTSKGTIWPFCAESAVKHQSVNRSILDCSVYYCILAQLFYAACICVAWTPNSTTVYVCCHRYAIFLQDCRILFRSPLKLRLHFLLEFQWQWYFTAFIVKAQSTLLTVVQLASADLLPFVYWASRIWQSDLLKFLSPKIYLINIHFACYFS